MLSNSDIVNFDLVIFMLLNKLYINDCNYISFDIYNLYYNLFSNYDFDKNRRVLSNIQNSISNLVKLGLINIIDNKSNCYVIDSSDLFIDTKKDNYITITDAELHSIFVDCKEYKLFRYFLNIISTINNTSKVGFTTIDKLADISFITKPTAIKYNSLLEDMKLIYIARSDLIQEYDGSIKRSSNTYGRYIDKDKVIKNFIKYNNAVASYNDDSKFIDDVAINRRSIKAKYNHFVKGTFKGNVNELHNDCVRYNNILSDADINSGMNRLDLSVF